MNTLKKKESEKKTVTEKTVKSGKKTTVKSSSTAKKAALKTSIKKNQPAAKTVTTPSGIIDDNKTLSNAKSGKDITSRKKENPADKFYKLLTEEEKDEKEVEEIDPEAFARGDEPMSIISHLDELRSRIIVILISFMIITAVAFYFSDILVYYINKPFLDSGNKLNIFTLIGGFMLKFKVSAATAIFILVPLIIFQIWRFIVPAIERKNRTFSRLTIISAILLFYSELLLFFFYYYRQQ